MLKVGNNMTPPTPPTPFDKESIYPIINRRAQARISPKICKYLFDFGIKNFVIAGGGLLKTYSDLDLYVLESESESRRGLESLLKQKHDRNNANVHSLTLGGRHVQICKHTKPSLKELIDSFDFSHCQVGAAMTLPKDSLVLCSEIYYTPEFVSSMAMGTTTYTGSEYPLSSLIRIPKVAKKLGLRRQEVLDLTIKVLANILERGFANEEDFKDQMQAVDLVGVPTDAAALITIYERLSR